MNDTYIRSAYIVIDSVAHILTSDSKINPSLICDLVPIRIARAVLDLGRNLPSAPTVFLPLEIIGSSLRRWPPVETAATDKKLP